jgi:hypothetical protein
MVTKFIEIPEEKWGCLLVWDFDVLDYDDIWAICKTFGMSDKNIRKALSILSAYNTGMTVSNPDIRMSVIFVSSATSPSEWWNTAVHELKHTADAIIRYYGVDWDGEDAAYLTGYLTKQLVEKVSEPCY